MKMTKKILFGAAALCAAVLFSGCDWSLTSALQKSIGTDIFKYNDATYDSGLGTWTVDNKTNETEDYIRGGKLLLTKHSDIAGLVTINDGYASGEAVGNLGLLFNVSQNKSDKTADNYGTWNFCVIGVQAVTASNVRYYVSYFANVVEDDMGKDNFGVTATKNSVDTTVLTPYEIELQSWTTISSLASSGTFSIVFDVDENDDGSYTVQPYKADTVSDSHVFTASDASKIGTTLAISADTLGKSGTAQAYVGAYGMIKAGQTLDGSIEVLDLTKQAILLAE